MNHHSWLPFGLALASVLCRAAAAHAAPPEPALLDRPTAVMAMPAAVAAMKAERVPPRTKGAPARVRIRDASADQLEVGSVNGLKLTPLPASLTLEAGEPTVELEAGAQVVVRRRVEQPRVIPLTTRKQSLPATVLVGTRDAANQTLSTQLQPFIAADLLPLHWEDSLAGYVTTVLVGLDPEGTGDLPPIEGVFQITGRNLSQIEPNQVTVRAAGPAGYQHIRLVTTGIEPVEIAAHSAYGDLTLSAEINPGPTRFELAASDASIDGFGIGVTTLSVTHKAANGMPLPATDLLRVSLNTTRGQLEPPVLEIPAQQTIAELHLVSAGMGRAVVSEAGSPRPGVPVQFTFPWLKLLLGLGGALAAGALRSRNSTASRASILAGSVFSGLVIDILLALGAPIAASWTLLVIRRELAWFALGFLGGLAGLPLLEKLAQRTFGGGAVTEAKE